MWLPWSFMELYARGIMGFHLNQQKSSFLFDKKKSNPCIVAVLKGIIFLIHTVDTILYSGIIYAKRVYNSDTVPN